MLSGLDPVDLHHIVVNTWEPSVTSEQNVVLISIASMIDPSMAPPGKHTLHAYLPATVQTSDDHMVNNPANKLALAVRTTPPVITLVSLKCQRT